MLSTSNFTFNQSNTVKRVTIFEDTIVNINGLEITGREIKEALIDNIIMKKYLQED